MIKKLKEFMDNVKWEWIIIMVLLINKASNFFVWIGMFFAGVVLYPTEPNPEIFYNVSQTVANSLVAPIQTMVETGFTVGGWFYPYNSLIANIATKMIVVITIIMILFLVYLIFISIKKKVKR